MSEHTLTRRVAISGALVALVMGTPVLFAQLGGDDPNLGPAWVWWLAYLGYLVTLAVLAWIADRLPRLSRHWFVVGLFGFGCLSAALTPEAGSVAVLIVVTAAAVAAIVSLRVTAGVVTAQTLLVAPVALMTGVSLGVALLQVAIYAVLQVSAVLLVRTLKREVSARAELTAANIKLQAATALLAESTRSTERLRIARDLHDLVGHQLTALSLELEVAAHKTTPPASDHVTRARRIAKDLLRDVREVVGQLRHQHPELRGALEEVISGIHHPDLHLRVDETIDVDQQRLGALVLCTQELITNTVRHADADNLWIELTETRDGRIRLSSRDDGCGAVSLRMGNGLTGICERIEQFGGSISIEHDDGFRVVAEMSAA